MSTTTFLLAGGAALAAVLVLGVLAYLLLLSARLRRDLAVTAAVVDGLTQQVTELEASLRRLRAEQRDTEARAGVVVSEGGVVALAPDEDRRPVPDQLVLSATLGEPLVKVAAFGHGVRRALRAESRNRIRFAMRQEVRRARRQRRRDMKAAYRAMQMQEDPA